LTGAAMTVPHNACDCHVHIFEPAAIAGLNTQPEVASLADYWQDRRDLGFTRTVFVQPSAFKFDNAGVLAALAAVGASARAVVTVEPGVTDATLQRLTGLGVTGARFHLLKSPLQSWDDLRPVAERVTPFGWHVQVQCDGRQLPERADMLASLPGTLVIDQTGKFLEPVSPDHPAFIALLRLIDKGQTYVKLSAPYEVSKSGPPGYADVSILAQALIRHAPDRMLWGSNWPHHALPAPLRVTNAAMLDWLHLCAPDDTIRHGILVTNPARLYGFSAAAF
jgi:D-galactarolactone isomerase